MNLLQTIAKPIIDQGRGNNVNNGNDAEILSASRMLMACGAEISWGSRNEDGRKIDLIVSYDHPWFDGERILVLVQVKSGPSFGERTPRGFKLTSTTIKMARRTSHDICLLWVDRIGSSIFWAYIHPQTRLLDSYGAHHRLTPAIRYDLARCAARRLPGLEGGTGVILSNCSFRDEDLKINRKQIYQSYILRRQILNPYLGNIEFTHIGWRHMFRESRSKGRKQQSLTVLRNIHNILEQKPSTIFGTFMSFTDKDDFTYRSMEFVLKYENVKIYDPTTGTISETQVVVRVREEIRWPREWERRSALTQEMARRVVLLSAYHK